MRFFVLMRDVLFAGLVWILFMPSWWWVPWVKRKWVEDPLSKGFYLVAFMGPGVWVVFYDADIAWFWPWQRRRAHALLKLLQEADK